MLPGGHWTAPDINRVPPLSEPARAASRACASLAPADAASVPFALLPRPPRPARARPSSSRPCGVATHSEVKEAEVKGVKEALQRTRTKATWETNIRIRVPLGRRFGVAQCHRDICC